MDVASLDQLILKAGAHHVIPGKEDPALLEQLRDPRVFQRCREILATSREKAMRFQAILCVERIGYVLRDQETAEMLLEHAAQTRDKYEVDTALTALSHLAPPRPLPAAPLIELIRRDRRHVRAVVECLRFAPEEDAEPVLLELARSVDRFERQYAALAFEHLSSEASLRALDALVDDKSADVQGSALHAIEKRLGAGVLPHARRVARGHRWTQYVALKLISQYGDASDVAAVAARVKRLFKVGTQYDPPEVSHLVPFLLRFPDDTRATAALRMLAGRAGELPKNERAWIEQNAPQILGR